MRLPGAASPGRRVTTPVQHIDLLPTILDRCGVAGAEILPGAALRAGDRPAAVRTGADGAGGGGAFEGGGGSEPMIRR